MKSSVHPEEMETIIEAFGKVRGNLRVHVHPDNQYPITGRLGSLAKPDPALYGREALAPETPPSPGADLLISALDAPDEPL
ncbi:hypothetical protein ACJZ2D_009030 [Fusarium nematophilum]